VLDDFVDRLLKSSYLDSYSLAAIADFYKQRGDRAKALALYLKDYFVKMGTGFEMYARSTQTELARLRAKRKP
jgi:hypothetical protein